MTRKIIVGLQLLALLCAVMGIIKLVTIQPVDAHASAVQADAPQNFYALLEYIERELPTKLIRALVLRGDDYEYWGIISDLEPQYVCLLDTRNRSLTESCIRIDSIDAIYFPEPLHP